MATNTWIELPATGSPSWKSPVANAAALPATGNTNGDTRVDLSTDTIYIWNGSAWIAVATPGAAIAIDGLIGDVSASGPGVVPATVNLVGGQSAANVASATTTVLSNKSANTVFAGPASGSPAAPAFRALVTADLPAGTGTVTSVSVVTANGLAGTVATATTTPAITLSTTITGILQGNGTAISAATTGNLTDAGTDGIVVTNGTGAVLGSGTSLAQHVADSTHNGYLSSTDFNTFNGKQSTITIGSLDAQAANTNGLALVANVLSTQSADATHPGMVNNTTQTLSGAKTFSGNLTASASSTSALTVGTNTFVVDTTNGLIGINTAPVAASIIDAVANTASATQVEQLTGYGINNIGLRIRHARGTSGTPTALQTGDVLGFLGARGYGTSQFAAANTGSFQFVAAENFTNTANGTYTSFNATPIGSVTLAEVMRAASTGVTLGPQSSSTAIHQVNGGVNYTTKTIAASTYTVDTTTTDYIIYTDSTSNAITITLPTPTNGRTLIIQDKTGKASTNNITINPHASETLNGLTKYVLVQNYNGMTLTSDGTNWLVLVIPTSGSQIITAGTTYTTPVNITPQTRFKFTLIGGGGAGGGNSTTANTHGAGGGSGGSAIVYLTGLAANTAYTIAIGAAGAGVSNGAGGNGGNTTLNANAVTYTAAGGSGGAASAATAVSGGAGGTTTNATVGITGQNGADTGSAAGAGVSGFGGDTIMGLGGSSIGAPATGNTAGRAGTGFGAGGSGSAAGAASATVGTGGAGTQGAILVEWQN